MSTRNSMSPPRTIATKLRKMLHVEKPQTIASVLREGFDITGQTVETALPEVSSGGSNAPVTPIIPDDGI